MSKYQLNIGQEQFVVAKPCIFPHPAVTERPDWEVFYPSGQHVHSYRSYPHCMTFASYRSYPHCMTFAMDSDDGIITKRKNWTRVMEIARYSAAETRAERPKA